uniref:C2H2-type domain-containing protein n=1 Tax=Plectus sambesii TaxID=2011161 RepID=A0A914W3U1_9BILA
PGFVPPSLSNLNQASTTPLSALAAALGQHTGVNVLHQGQITPQPSTSAGVLTQDRSPINKEAYCELCEKEFCNKYFLRTHKQKKHGIFTEDTPQSASDSPSSRKRPASTNGHNSSDCSPVRNMTKGSPALAEALQTSVIVANTQQPEPKQPKISDLLDVSGKPRSSLDSLLAAVTSSAGQQHGVFQCEVCTRVFPTYFTLATHKFREHSASLALPTTSAPTTTNSLHSLLASQQQHASSIDNTTTPPRPTAVDPDSYCEICDKEFCSKYFLRQHRFNIHGIASSEDSPGPGLTVAGGVQQLPNPFMLQQAAADSTPPQHLQQQTPKPKRQYITGKNYCDLCNKEVCNKYFLRTHMLKMHGIVIDENKTVIGNIDTLEKEKTGTLSFRCDICLKEMNTRQLLRAHKQEAHGIVPLGTPPSQNRNKSANSNGVPSSGGDVGQQRPMMINLSASDSSGPPNVTVTSNSSSRMRDDSSPYLSYASFTEVCPVCDGRFKSTALLQLHMQRDHANEVPADILASFQKATEQAAQIKAEQQLNQLPCEFCSLAFDDIIEHQLHIINDHPDEIRAKTNTIAASAAMASFKQEGDHATTNIEHQLDINRSANTESVEAVECEEDGTKGLPLVINNNGKKLYRCSYCTYYTPWPSNLSTHEKRHTLGTPISGEPHVCNVCLREYRYAHSLKRHKEVHRLGGSYERKYGSPDKHVAESPENANATTTVSPSKVAKRFRCTKCDKRFRTREQCREHLFAVHRRQELREALANHSPNKDLYRAVADENQAAVSAVVESLHQQLAEERRNKEEHDHTSGSASPTSEKMMAEGYARPLGTAHLDKPFVVQTFVMRERCDNGLKGQFLHELIAHLPVRSLLSDAVEVTFELVPAPHIDAQVKHL